MKLHEAIKRIIECDGKNVITDLRIINVLSDFQAYAACPATKYVLRSIIADGYSKRLLAIGSWGTDSQQLLNKFIRETGFQSSIADLVFQSIVYGLGWKSTVDTLSNISPEITIPPTNPNKIDGSQLNKTASQVSKMDSDTFQDYKGAVEEYLESIIEFKTDFNRDLGVEVNAFIKFDYAANIWPTFEIKGKIRIKYDYSMEFHVVCYNEKNRILCEDSVDVGIDHPSFEVCEAIIQANEYRRICDIKRIVVYWAL